MPSFDPVLLRPQFPALAARQDGRPVVFLDGPGGTQVPQRVIDAVADYYRESNANTTAPSPRASAATRSLEEAHAAVADLLGAASPAEVKFGQNMTSLTFALSRSIARVLRPGDEVVISRLDHEANRAPWIAAAADAGATVREIAVDPAACTLDLDSLDAALSERTRLVAVGCASNAVGTVNPVAEIVRRAHAVGAWTFVDAVHYAPHGPLDVASLGTDFLACSAYKFFGPHVGILWGRGELLDVPAGLQGPAGRRPLGDRHPEPRGDRRDARRGGVPRRRRRAVRGRRGRRRGGHAATRPAGRRHAGDRGPRAPPVRPRAGGARRHPRPGGPRPGGPGPRRASGRRRSR